MFDIGTKTLSQSFAEYLNTIREMCGGNDYARIWLEQIVQVALVWDHFVDEDPIDPKAFDEVLTILVTEWPLNPFARKNADSLIPTVVASISAWKYNKSRELHYSAYRELPCVVAFILGGNSMVEKFMPRIAELVQKMQVEDDARDQKEEKDA